MTISRVAPKCNTTVPLVPRCNTPGRRRTTSLRSPTTLLARRTTCRSPTASRPRTSGPARRSRMPTGVAAHPNGTVTDSDGKPIKGSSGGPGAGRRFKPETPDEERANSGKPCTYCGKPTTEEPRTPGSRTDDHIDPRSRGGNNSPDNRDPNVCQSCNSSKGNQSLWDWIRKKWGTE